MSDGLQEMLESSVSTQDMADVVFGDPCPKCATENPCDCGLRECACDCGRCMWPYPLPDDGPIRV